jgi:tRNA dimethylallyltransferase
MKKSIIIAGPTASGKTDLAIGLAKEFGGEIINADSVAVYKGFDIGSAKPSEEEMKEAPHHLFSLFEAHEDCDAGLYAKLAKEKIEEISSRGNTPIIVGGTGLYIRALLGESFHDLPHDPKIRADLTAKSKEELYELLEINDPDRAAELHPNDHFRLARALEIFYITGKTLKELTKEAPKNTGIDSFFIALEPDREDLLDRIERRTRMMIKKGLVREIVGLLESGVEKSSKPMQSIGYKEVIDFFERNGSFSDGFDLGTINSSEWQDLEEKIIISTRQFARRQTTWFKKVKKDLHFKNPDLEKSIEELKKHIK